MNSSGVLGPQAAEKLSDIDGWNLYEPWYWTAAGVSLFLLLVISMLDLPPRNTGSSSSDDEEDTTAHCSALLTPTPTLLTPTPTHGRRQEEEGESVVIRTPLVCMTPRYGEASLMTQPSRKPNAPGEPRRHRPVAVTLTTRRGAG